MMEYILIALAWLVFIAVGIWWFLDYGKTIGFETLKHNKAHGKAVL